MTGPEFLTYVRRKLKRTDKDTEVYEATADIIADIRLQIKAEEYKEEEYITGISTLGDYNLTLPSDFKQIIGEITYIDEDSNDFRVLDKISKQEYDRRHGERHYSAYGNMDADRPRDFCIYGNEVYLGPVPDSTSYKYKINYTSEDYGAISASTTSVPFTDYYRNIMRNGVLAEVYDGMEMFDESQYWRAMYLDGLGKLNNNYEENTNDKQPIAYSGF